MPKIFDGVDGGRSEGKACADPGARTPIGASGIFGIMNVKVLTKPNIGIEFLKVKRVSKSQDQFLSYK